MVPSPNPPPVGMGHCLAASVDAFGVLTPNPSVETSWLRHSPLHRPHNESRRCAVTSVFLRPTGASATAVVQFRRAR